MVFKSHIFGNKTVIVSDPMQLCRLSVHAFSKLNLPDIIADAYS